MKYLVTYIYDDWNKDDCVGIETCDNIESVNGIIRSIKLSVLDDGNCQRNIKVFKAEEITEQFDTKTKFDEE